ncbi:hypothetical protein OPKNFCMD_3368 [Methylobacterium crusticola]|uniref:Glycosyltransferase family 1 protein n=1 Tax=Methylobacterium crusticola TaxID=1697972 RepID=A0ABQ4QYY6_9HYPH|nr:hypothetical protein [Methylobacterium crusticola]GJD50625.1 hypothetical protein OPKNFCMD_3368 [Methylobacterium crusticola]
MKICFVVSSEEHKASAGARIRYGRLRPEIALGDLAVSIATAESLAKASALVHDAYVFSKIYGVVPSLLIRRMRTAGKLVGIDIFDDYFSQVEDTRLFYFRRWLDKYGELFQFVLCSTERLRAMVRSRLPGRPVLLLPDAAAPYEWRRVATVAAQKLHAVLASRVIDVLWFGIGTNPYFPVGIADLAGQGEALAGLARDGWSARLTVLTNARTLPRAALASIARLPVEARIEEWTLEREAELIAASFLAFLPVGGQPFSQAKSLNRAVTALTGGCQVLAPGFPLYEALGEGVYAAPEALLRDLDAGTARLTPDAMARLTVRLAGIADAFDNAAALAGFLARIGRRAGAGRPPPAPPPNRISRRNVLRTGHPIDTALVHGASPDFRALDLARALGALQVKGPFFHGLRAYDLHFDPVPHPREWRMRILVRPDLTDFVAPAYRQHLVPFGPVHEVEMLQLDPAVAATLFHAPALPLLALRSPLREACAYPEVMRETVRCCAILLPELRIQVSELANLHLPAFG